MNTIIGNGYVLRYQLLSYYVSTINVPSVMCGRYLNGINPIDFHTGSVIWNWTSKTTFKSFKRSKILVKISFKWSPLLHAFYEFEYLTVFCNNRVW